MSSGLSDLVCPPVMQWYHHLRPEVISTFDVLDSHSFRLK